MTSAPRSEVSWNVYNQAKTHSRMTSYGVLWSHSSVKLGNTRRHQEFCTELYYAAFELPKKLSIPLCDSKLFKLCTHAVYKQFQAEMCENWNGSFIYYSLKSSSTYQVLSRSLLYLHCQVEPAVLLTEWQGSTDTSHSYITIIIKRSVKGRTRSNGKPDLAGENRIWQGENRIWQGENKSGPNGTKFNSETAK